jgi:hypothetical protein
VNEIYKDKLEILRQRIPIGLRHGLTLLEKADGNIEKAEEYFRDEMVVLTLDKRQVTSDIALRHLEKNNFDIHLTIKSIDEELYTLIEIIMHAIEETKAIERKFWLNFEDLKKLPDEVFCLLTVMEWLNYESYENLDAALSFELEIVTKQLENKLALPDLANSLLRASEIKRLTYEKNELKILISSRDKKLHITLHWHNGS